RRSDDQGGFAHVHAVRRRLSIRREGPGELGFRGPCICRAVGPSGPLAAAKCRARNRRGRAQSEARGRSQGLPVASAKQGASSAVTAERRRGGRSQESVQSVLRDVNRRTSNRVPRTGSGKVARIEEGLDVTFPASPESRRTDDWRAVR